MLFDDSQRVIMFIFTERLHPQGLYEDVGFTGLGALITQSLSPELLIGRAVPSRSVDVV